MLTYNRSQSKIKHIIQQAKKNRHPDAQEDHRDRIGARLLFGGPDDFFHLGDGVAEVGFDGKNGFGHIISVSKIRLGRIG